MEWLIPLKRDFNHSQGNFMPSDTSGHVLFVVHSRVLHALSPVDRKVLWTEQLDPKGDNYGYYSGNTSIAQPMQRSDQFSPFNLLQQESAQRNSPIAAVNSDYVCVTGRRTLAVHDAITGRLRWSKDRLPNGARVYGTDSLVFIVPPDTGKTQVHSAIDGSRVDVTNIGPVLQRTMRVLPEGFIMAENKAGNSILGLAKGTTMIRYFNPAEGRNLWTADYPGGTYLSLMDDNYLVALEPSGTLELLDLETGSIKQMPGLTEEDLKSKTEVRAVSDHANLYLIINKQRQNNGYYYGYYNDGNMPSIPVNGLVFAWDRETGKMLWKQQVNDQQLMLTHFTHAPFLVFNRQSYKQIENMGFSVMSTLALDKFTGKTQVDVTAPSNYSNFQKYDLHLGQRMLEFRSYQLRLRITALPPGSAEVESAENPKPAIAE
jgi:outer membrane protein assembly factor BamB